MTEHIDLKPCPFCAAEQGRVVIYKSRDKRKGGSFMYHIHCMDCGTDGPYRVSYSGSLEAWNTRPLEDALALKLAEAQ
jgi:Lar family restriction alleviation protein